jgi:inosine-uridine nucleoside N-ribohydrolase
MFQIMPLFVNNTTVLKANTEIKPTSFRPFAKQRVGMDQVSLAGNSFQLSILEQQALNELSSLKPKVPQSIFLITDPNKDPDDIASFPLASQLQKDGHVKVEGAVTTLGNKEIRTQRALLTQGVFRQLGLDVPVGVGNDYVPASDKRFKDDQAFLDDAEVSNKTFITSSSAEEGERLIVKTLEKVDDKSLTVVVNAGMRDIADVIQNNPSMFAQKVRRIAIMGGISDFDNDGHVLPDTRAYNNTTDIEAAQIVYKRAQELNIPIRVVTKETAYSAAVPKTFYEALRETEHPVGKYLYGIQKIALEGLWGTVKKGIIPSLTPEWFAKTFTSLDLENTKHKQLFDQIQSSNEPFETLWNEVTKLNLYDPINLLAGVFPENNGFFKSINENKIGKSIVQRVEVVNAEKLKALLLGLSKLALKN